MIKGYVRLEYKSGTRLALLQGGIYSIRNLESNSTIYCFPEGEFEGKALDLMGCKNGSCLFLFSERAIKFCNAIGGCEFHNILFPEHSNLGYALLVPEFVMPKSKDLVYSLDKGFCNYCEESGSYLIDESSPFLINGQVLEGNSHFISISSLRSVNLFVSIEMMSMIKKSSLKGFVFDFGRFPGVGEMVSRI